MTDAQTKNLFEAGGLQPAASQPLADRLRPDRLGDVIGQDHIIGPDGLLKKMIDAGRLTSIVFWGPPGTGKTTIARLLAKQTSNHFEQLSAIHSGVQDLRKVFEQARIRRRDGVGTVLFVDEVHRFNRSQQDSFLPVMEDGTIVLIGATTENPSFELNSALLSRATVLTLQRLDEAALEVLLGRSEVMEGRELPVVPDARNALKNMADGDGRMLLNLAEEIFLAVPEGNDALGLKEMTALIQRRAPLYDKSQDGHYNLISALHKSIRGSDPDASLYWLARILEGGEDPLFVARRLVRMAIEDIGMADPQALVQANAAKDAYHFLGSPEGELALAQTAVYLAVAPKSNASYAAFKGATRLAREAGSLAPPKHILNAPTDLMRSEGYGQGYEYDHDSEGGVSGQNYFPDDLPPEEFYQPTDRGVEQAIQERLKGWRELRARRRGGDS